MKNNRQAGMLWVIATLVVAIFPQLTSMPPHIMFLMILPMAWRLIAEFRQWKPPHMAIRVSVTIITVFTLISTFGSLLGRRAAVGLLCLMLCLKLLETFKVRDARIVASLSLFVCATQFLFSQGIFMLVYAGCVVLGSLISMALLQRLEAFRPKGIAPSSGHSIFSELGYSSKLVAIAIPVALALFMFFPRWGSPLWGVPESSLDAKSGLSESMSPGSIQNLFMDDSPAFRANFDQLTPSQNSMYWRGPVFWDFDGTVWRGTYYSRNLPAAEKPTVSSNSWLYQIQLEPTEQHWIFALDYPAIVPKGVRLTMDYQLYSRRSITQLKNYNMASNPNFVDSPTLGNTHRSTALGLPQGYNPQILRMIESWRTETSSDVDFVNRALMYFNEEEFRYTLNPPLLSRHTVDEFLFDTRSGFCEHYASAFTVMMRMAGIPARIVTGYQGGWYNDFGNYVLVRQSDAHAWSEVWLPESGWTRVDPTAAVAPSRVERGSLDALNGRRYLFDYQWLRSVKNGFDLLQRGWNQWVIAFSAERQMNMFMPFGLGIMDSKKLVAIMVLIIGGIGLLMLPMILRLKISGNTDPAAKQWSLFRKKLDDAGVSSRASMTPAELYLVASTELQDQAEAIGHISKLYREIRYAPDGPEVDWLTAAVKNFQPPKRKRRARSA